MSAIIFIGILVCFHGCVIQNVFGQCLPIGLPLGYGGSITECGCGQRYGPGIDGGVGNGYGRNAAEVIGAYGGAGTGDLDVAGELPVSGITIVTGQVPILGAVQFGGEVPAGGVVSIFGKCGCDCNGSPLF